MRHACAPHLRWFPGMGRQYVGVIVVVVVVMVVAVAVVVVCVCVCEGGGRTLLTRFPRLFLVQSAER